MRCLEISLFYRCVNRCVFCSNSEVMREFAREKPSIDEIGAELARWRGRGYGHVTFSGGEPTLSPRVWAVLRRAKELGYRTRVVSNGAGFSVPGFADAALPALDEICLSILSDRAREHDAMTRRAGSFDKIIVALKAALRAERAPRVTVNTAVTRVNAGRLPELARMIASYGGVGEFWISALIPEGEALRGYADLSLPYAEVMRHAHGAAERAVADGIKVGFFGFPECALGRWSSNAGEREKNPSAAVALRRVESGVAFAEIPPEEGPRRVKASVCAACPRAAVCAGVWERHLRQYGETEVSCPH